MRYLGRRSGLPALPVYYACRFAGLLSYILLVWLAVRLIPFGKWIFALLAASPMALFQAATISHDSISNGIGFLFIGGCLAIAYRQKVSWKEWAALVFLLFLLFLTKINLVFLVFLPFLFLSSSRFTMKGGYGLLVAAAVILFLVEAGGWNAVVFSHSSNPFPQADPLGQLKNILLHPFGFIQTILSDLWNNAKAYSRQWFGVYGYGYWSVPFVVYILYTIGLGLALFRRTGDGGIKMRLRMILIAVFILGYLATVGAMYLSNTPVGSSEILGVQGRYFIPIVPLFLLALSELPPVKHMRTLTWLAAGCIIASLAFFTLGYN
jgi:uncharacterized membrane protein